MRIKIVLAAVAALLASVSASAATAVAAPNTRTAAVDRPAGTAGVDPAGFGGTGAVVVAGPAFPTTTGGMAVQASATIAAYFSRAANGHASIAVPSCAPSISTQGLEASTRRPYRSSSCSRTGLPRMCNSHAPPGNGDFSPARMRRSNVPSGMMGMAMSAI